MPERKKLTHKEIKELVHIADKVKLKKAILPSQVEKITSFQIEDSKSKLQNILLKIALPASIIFGMSQAAFPEFYSSLVTKLPAWTNLGQNLLAAVDYVWSIIGKPVKMNNIIYHIPNIFLYSFGVIGVKKLFDYVRRKTWLDKVNEAKTTLQKNIEKGNILYALHEHHSILLIGKGDFIGEQFCLNSKIDNVITLGSSEPSYTNHWIKYDISNSYSSLEKALLHADAESAGEYVLFPVKDTELFLPGEKQYDVAPEKVEIMIHTIRDVEKMNNWEPKRIIIVGDRKQITCVRTETKKSVLEDTIEDISLTSIDKEIRKVTILDASDLVIKEILRRFPNRKIYLRTSVDGSNMYKKRFFDRLEELGYNDEIENTTSLVVGYDIYEEQVEREIFKSKLQEYLPVILSKDAHDAILRKGYSKEQIMYVPDLVLTELKKIAEAN
ncbi:MAG: hypothetical protein H7Y00_02340 [Fimbriimonadaceae bacterium]|nr:hypothetical protein [Chitinophagales bacterium]